MQPMTRVEVIIVFYLIDHGFVPRVEPLQPVEKLSGHPSDEAQACALQPKNPAH
jgi:hypothetical protein